MNVDPNLLPPIPLWVRQWSYLLYLLALVTLNGIDAFWESGDPWWLAGALRAANVVGIVVTAIALANARPTVAEQAKRQADEQPADPVAPVMGEGDLGVPENLRRPDGEWTIDRDL